MSIAAAIDRTIGAEGGYSNHAADLGGTTKWGITERVARRNGYMGDMRSLPRDTAVEIYRQEYFVRPGFAGVFEIMPKVGEELFDTGVNMGQAFPSLWLQQCLNAFNNGGRHYPDIAEDGDIGPGTLRALKAYKDMRGAEGERVLLAALNCLQGARYLEITRKRGANEAFAFGWFKRVML